MDIDFDVIKEKIDNSIINCKWVELELNFDPNPDPTKDKPLLINSQFRIFVHGKDALGHEFIWGFAKTTKGNFRKIYIGNVIDVREIDLNIIFPFEVKYVYSSLEEHLQVAPNGEYSDYGGITIPDYAFTTEYDENGYERTFIDGKKDSMISWTSSVLNLKN